MVLSVILNFKCAEGRRLKKGELWWLVVLDTLEKSEAPTQCAFENGIGLNKKQINSN